MLTSRTTVLVVEDEPLIRWCLADDLRDLGFDVVEAADADEAITTIMANPNIQAIVTDIDMPGTMDGLKLAQFVRDRWPPIRIIVTSGNWDASKVALPASERFISKPYDPRIVAGTINELIGVT